MNGSPSAARSQESAATVDRAPSLEPPEDVSTRLGDDSKVRRDGHFVVEESEAVAPESRSAEPECCRMDLAMGTSGGCDVGDGVGETDDAGEWRAVQSHLGGVDGERRLFRTTGNIRRGGGRRHASRAPARPAAQHQCPPAGQGSPTTRAGRRLVVTFPTSPEGGPSSSEPRVDWMRQEDPGPSDMRADKRSARTMQNTTMMATMLYARCRRRNLNVASRSLAEPTGVVSVQPLVALLHGRRP